MQTFQRENVGDPNRPSPPRNGWRLDAATAVLPLRFYMGIAVLWAGIDKLTDNQFLNSAAPQYIGKQLQSFVDSGSPLSFFLSAVAVPNASLFGFSVILGEIAIGLGTLFGLLSRVAAIFGAILAFTLYLTATWTVQPFYYGVDLIFVFGWMTLAIAGPHPVYSLDGLLSRGRSAGGPAMGGVPVAAGSRRAFVASLAGLAVLMAGFATLRDVLRRSNSTTATTTTTTASTTTAPSSTSQTGNGNSTPAATTAAAGGTTAQGAVIAKLSDLQSKGAIKFTTPDSNEPAWVVLSGTSAKAFSDICTHQGCEVAYQKSANNFNCPCHGSQFSATDGSVTRGPAKTALKSYKVSVDAASGNVLYLQQ